MPAQKSKYALLSRVATELDQLSDLDRIAQACLREQEQAEQNGDEIAKTLISAVALSALREKFDDRVLEVIRPLLGSPLGIGIDRKDVYADEDIREAILQGLLRGARLIGREIQIIRGNCYLTGRYWERRFKESERVSDVSEPVLGIPRIVKLGPKTYARVNAKLQFRLDGKPRKIERVLDDAIVVVCDEKTSSIDSIHGKVRGRLFKLAYGEIATATVDWVEDENQLEENLTRLEDAKNLALEEIRTASSKEKIDSVLASWEEAEAHFSEGATSEDLKQIRLELLEASNSRLREIENSDSSLGGARRARKA